MNKLKNRKDILEWIVASILLFLCIYYYFLSYGSFSAMNEFKASERSFDYGPSEIKKEINLKNGKIFLAKYKDWFSANLIEKGLIKWYSKIGVSGIPINYSEQVTSAYGATEIGNKEYISLIYGYVNAPNISEITLEVELNGKDSISKYNITSDKLFIFNWNENIYKYNLIALSGLDKNGKKLYEHKYK